MVSSKIRTYRTIGTIKCHKNLLNDYRRHKPRTKTFSLRRGPKWRIDFKRSEKAKITKPDSQTMLSQGKSQRITN